MKDAWSSPVYLPNEPTPPSDLLRTEDAGMSPFAIKAGKAEAKSGEVEENLHSRAELV